MEEVVEGLVEGGKGKGREEEYLKVWLGLRGNVGVKVVEECEMGGGVKGVVSEERGV